MAAIEITDLTNNVTITTDNEVIGDGIFDDLMETVTKHITAQFKAGRIKGEDFAEVYLGSMQATLQHSVEILLTKPRIDLEIELGQAQIRKTEAEIDNIIAQTELTYKQVEVADKNMELIDKQIEQLSKQIELITAQIATEIAKEALLQRQKQGFDDDIRQKILRHITELWSVAYSVAGTNNDVELPNTVTSQNLELVMRQVAEDAGIDYPPIDNS